MVAQQMGALVKAGGADMASKKKKSGADKWKENWHEGIYLGPSGYANLGVLTAPQLDHFCQRIAPLLRARTGGPPVE